MASIVQRKWDRIHEINESCNLLSEDAAGDTTIIPLIMNDDAKGDPMSFNANPEHASFAETDEPNCFPDSEIRNFKLTIDVQTYKAFNETDKQSTYDFEYALISCAFPEDLDSLDEKSGLTLKEIIELQKETTDRQCYPLWSGADINVPSLLSANVPGLTTTQAIEAVAWDGQIVKDQQRYGKVKGLLKKVLPMGIRRVIVNTKRAQGKRITIRFVPSNAKFINPYTFLGIMLNRVQCVTNQLRIPDVHSVVSGAEVSGAAHASFTIQCKYNERNPEFHMAKV